MTGATGKGFSAATRRIVDPAGALADAAAAYGEPVASWTRGDDRLDAYGVRARLTFAGAARIGAAAAAWRAIGATARVDDPVRVPGTGLIAFGAFAFADESPATSVLLVPERVVGHRDGIAFVTTIDGGGAAAAPARLPVDDPRAHMPADAYVAAVRGAVRRIRGGALDKVVLARDLVLDTAPSVAEALERLRRRYTDAWVFAVDGFFGASPETLVTVRRGTMTSRVLAGTAERGGEAAADDAARRALLESGKNRFEHALAVDSLLLTLGESVRDLVIGRPFALGLPNVWHLATDATGTVAPGVGALDLVELLHPTAAVAGAPREAALQVIRELEPFDRGRYAGPVGWVDAGGDGEWAIGLRSAQAEAPGRVRAYAGAGIVAESDALQELAETGWKFAPILEACSPVVATAS